MALTSGTAVDISNYTGMLDSRDVAWLRDNAQLVIVRLSTEDGHRQRDIAGQQVRALADAGIPWQGYLWCYWDQSPFEHWERAQDRLPLNWPGYYGGNIWLDMEDPAGVADQAFDWINSYASLLRADRFTPAVYTGSWWIRQNGNNFVDGRGRYWLQYPLWAANYSVPPGEPVPAIAPWAQVAMHQFASVDTGPVLRSYDLSAIYNVE